MIPQPQGFAIVVEPVDRERIENLAKELGESSAGFGNKVVPGYEGPCLLRVVAAGPGVQYEDAFIPNHINVGDKILGTISEVNIARDFLDTKSHWEFDGKKLCRD